MAFQILVLAVGVGIGFIKKGTIWNLSNLKMRIWWILPVAYLLQHFSIFYLSGVLYEWVIVASYALMVMFCVVNIRIPGVIWAMGGTVANFTALAVNGLRMPAYMPAIKAMAPQIVPAIQAGHYGKSVAMSNATHLNFLGDIFGFNVHPVSILSVGDILFSIGLIILIQYAMRLGREDVVNA